MDSKQAIREECQALQRIVTLLLSFACLAEATCARSMPVRAFVLWLLGRAEAVAFDFVMDEDPDCNPRFRHACASPAEAMSLARSFRALADELVAEMEHIAGTFSSAWDPSRENEAAIICPHVVRRSRRLFSAFSTLFRQAKGGLADAAPFPDTS